MMSSHRSRLPRRAYLPALACSWILANAGCSAAGAIPGEEAYGSVTESVTGPFPWKGYTWQPTTGGMAGVVPGDAANVSIDANGYLHLRIVSAGNAWTASEVFTTTNLGFGTYQWQIEGPIDRMDHTIVLGFFPYGPTAGIGVDGQNEIDTEFSYWNDELTNVNVDWGVYPANASGMHWERDFMFSLNGGNATTARMVWSSKGVKSTLMTGYQAIGSSNNVLSTYDYTPSNPNNNVPQQAVPLGMNLWCYKGVPSSGKNVEVIVRDFQFIPEGQPIPGDDAGGPLPEAGQDDAAPSDDGGASAPEAGVDAPTGDDASSVLDAPATQPDAGTNEASASAGTPGDAALLPLPDASAAAAGPSSTGASDGCSCHAAGPPGGRAGLPTALGALLGIALRRRRSRSGVRTAAGPRG